MWTDPGWFIHQLAVWISYWSLAAWPPTSRTCGLSTLYSSSFGTTETMVFAKQNKTPISNMPPALFSPETSPPPHQTGGGGGAKEDFGTWLKTSVRLKFNNKMLVKYSIISFWCVDTLESIVLLDLLSEYREKTLRGMGENQQQTQTTYGVDAGIWTRATLVARVECALTAAPPLL